MHHKDLESLFLSEPFVLPNLEEDEDNSFLHHFKTKADAFFEQLQLLPVSAFEDYNNEILLDRVEKIITGLKTTIQFYLDGYPAKAFVCFKNMIENANLSTELIAWRTIKLKDNYRLYRIKKEHNNKNPIFVGKSNGFGDFLKSIELFHVPFEKRRAIGTNRFSIPGFPCVYLSDSLHTSWSECSLAELDIFHAVCLTNHRPLYIADLVPINCLEKEKADATLYEQKNPYQAFIDYVFVYPLILACHSKIKYKSLFDGEVKFKSEYIIPQLLLQWYREEKILVDGIRYLSCTVEKVFPSKKIAKFNYVIPAYESNEKGYCPSLLINFSGSPTYSYIKPLSGSSIESVLDEISNALIIQKFSPLSNCLIPLIV